MPVKIYSKENCPKCRLLVNRMQDYGIEFEYHTAEFHSDSHDGWRTDGSVDAKAAISYCDDNLPAVVWHGVYFDFEGAMNMAVDTKRNWIIDYAKTRGWEIDREVLQDVENNEFNCPCKSSKVVCPCPGHDTAVETKGQCHCGLFKKAKE